MSGIQFMHAEGYSRNGSKLKGAKGVKKGEKRKQVTGGWSARQILSEVLREPESCRHVQHPQPPMSVYGNMEALVAGIETIPDKRKGIRGDTPIMLTGIASAPWPPGDERSVKWHKDVVDHLLKKFGDDLKVTVAHVDEPHDHLHFYITLHDYQPIKGIHPGMKMRDETKAAGGTDAEINKAYKDAMIQWQDEYFVDVGIANAQTRIGPGVQRLQHNEWVAQKESAVHSALALKVIDQAWESARIASDELTQRAKSIEAEALEMAAQVEMEALKIRGEVNAHAQAEEDRLIKVKAVLDAERARQADERARQAEVSEGLKKAHLVNKAKAEALLDQRVHLDVLVHEAQTKVTFLDKMIDDFQSAMSSIHDRLSFFEKVAILPFLSAVAQVKARFAGIHGRAKQKAKSGLDL